jgi:hypothetical protein
MAKKARIVKADHAWRREERSFAGLNFGGAGFIFYRLLPPATPETP